MFISFTLCSLIGCVHLLLQDHKAQNFLTYLLSFLNIAKTKALISFTVNGKLICIFVCTYANCWFSHATAQILTSLRQEIFSHAQRVIASRLLAYYRVLSSTFQGIIQHITGYYDLALWGMNVPCLRTQLSTSGVLIHDFSFRSLNTKLNSYFNSITHQFMELHPFFKDTAVGGWGGGGGGGGGVPTRPDINRPLHL